MRMHVSYSGLPRWHLSPHSSLHFCCCFHVLAGAMVRVRTLQRVTVPHNLLPDASPAATHSHRVATHFVENGTRCNVYIASGVDVYCIKMDLKEPGVDSGKEGLLIPVDSEVAGAWQVEQCPHRGEIQGIALTPSPSDEGFLLGSVDAYGRLVVTSLNSDIQGSSYTAGPETAGVGEGWWAGIVFNRNQPTLAAVGRGLAKAVDLYDKDIYIRTLRTLQHPTSLTFLNGPLFDNGSMLAVTEGPQLSIWDLRQGERGGCVQRILGAFSGECLNAVTCSPEGLVAIGGAERVVLVMDPLKFAQRKKNVAFTIEQTPENYGPRVFIQFLKNQGHLYKYRKLQGWTPRSRWTSCLKYEITGLSFSAVDPDLMYVHGLDYEVVCGPWNREKTGGSNARAFAFRGDSRWLGFDKCYDSDLFAGWSETGTIYAGHVESDADVGF